MKLYGEVQRYGDSWWVHTDPNLMIKLKRWFPRVNANREGALVVWATAEVSRDLEWFMERYPMKMSEKARKLLGAEASEDKALEQDAHDILLGKGIKRDLKWEVPRARDYQLIGSDLALRTGKLLIADDVGLGKAQPLDSPVLTPRGFRSMGSIEVGDLVTGADGKPTKVLGVFPQGELSSYRVKFSDGVSVECSKDHLWWVSRHVSTCSKTDGRQLPYFWRAMTIQELMDSGLENVNGQSKWHIPLVKAPNLRCGRRRPLDPYLLGALLGDGGLTGKTVYMTSADQEVMDEIEDRLPEGILVRKVANDKYGYRLVSFEPSRKPHPLAAPLEYLGLRFHGSLEKFVPEQYKLAPSEVRLLILQGLMDTDGYAMSLGSGNASAFFYSSSLQLAEDVRWIVESLGGIGKFSKKYFKGRDRYTVTVKLPAPYNPFRLKRKAELWGDGHQTLPPTRAIRSIERAGSKPMQCLRVASADHLYITDRFTVTHNTLTGTLALRDANLLPALIVCPTHLPQQFEEEIAEFMPWLLVHIAKKGTPYTLAKYHDGRRPDVLIMGYSKLAGWAPALRGKVKSVLFDEGQELRHQGTQKYEAAGMVADLAKVVQVTTATPVYNYGNEIFNIVEIYAPGALGVREEFIREWGKYIGNHIGVKDPAALAAYLKSQNLMIQRTRKEVGRELPETIKVPHMIESDEAEFERLMEGAEHSADLLVSREASKEELFTLTGQFEWQMRKATGVAKAGFVAEFTKSLLESGEKVVLFGWHHDVYDIWREQLKEFNPVFYTGQESPAQKLFAKNEFINGEARVFIMSLRSGAGLNGLQEASHIAIFGELDWSPTMHDQCVGRMRRDGMKEEEPVVAYYLVSENGSDPMVADVLNVKRGQSEPFIDPNAKLVEVSRDTGASRARQMAETFLARK